MNYFKENRVIFQTYEEYRKSLLGQNATPGSVLSRKDFETQNKPASTSTATGGSYNVAGTQVGAGKGQYASAEEAAAARRAADIASGKVKIGTPLPEAQSALDVAKDVGADITDAYLNMSPINRLDNTIAQMKDQEQQAELKAQKSKSVIAEQLAAAKAAAASRFAESPEGVQTSTSAGLVSRATAGAERSAERASDTINSGLETLKRLNAQAAEAGVKGEVARQESIVKQAAAVQAQIEEAQREYEASGQKATQDVLNLFDKMDASQLEALSGLDADAFAQTIQAINPQITGLRAAGLQALAKTLSTIDETSPDYQKKLLEVQKLQQELSGTAPQDPTTSMQDFAFYQQLQTSDPEMAKRFAEMKGFSDAQIKADLAKTQADINSINSKISPTYSGTGGATINISDIGNGSALALNTLGDSSTTLRTDRHNNPTANKAYQTTIDRLKAAGLVQGIDFDVGETTEGIDSDGVPTIMYKDAATGVQGSIVTLKAGEIGSWYANPKYGGAPIILSKLSELSGQTVNSLNAQDIFNNLDTAQQAEVVKAIYSHEGGTQLFTSALSSQQQLEAAKISAEIFGKAGGASSKPENLSKVENLMKEGLSADDIRDQLRMGEQSEEFAGTIRDAAESIAINLPSGKGETFFNSLDRMLADGNIQGAKEQIKRAARSSAGVDEAKIVAGSERTLEFIGEISNDLKAFAEKGGDTGIFTGTTEKMMNKIGRTTDPDLAKVATKIAKAIQSYRRSMSGVAFSVPESEEYKGIFPSIDKIDEFNIAKIEALNEIMQGDVDFFYKNAMGASAYKDIFEGGALDKAPKPDPLGIGAGGDPLGLFN